MNKQTKFYLKAKITTAQRAKKAIEDVISASKAVSFAAYSPNILIPLIESAAMAIFIAKLVNKETTKQTKKNCSTKK